jgi:hypothetical protein
MAKPDIRLKLERHIGRPVPDDIWDWLVQHGHAHIEPDEEEEGLRDIVETARSLIRLQSQKYRSFPGETHQHQRVVPLAEYESERAEAISSYAALLCGPRARAFRKEILASRILTLEETLALITSPAAAAFRPSWFKKHGVPLVGHEAQWEEKQENQVLHIKRPKLKVRVRRKPEDYLRFVGPDGWERSQPVWRDSVLDRLRALVAHLCQRYGWQETQAMGFVLMDALPLIAPMITRVENKTSWDLAEIRKSAKITLTVEAWVSAETVVRGFREAQKRLLAGENRPLAIRNLALFRFITGMMRSAGELPPWRRLMDAWNQGAESRERNWAYTDRRRFCRDYQRARQALLTPDLRDPHGVTRPRETKGERSVDRDR